jgi:hypothetical protein
MERVKAGSEAGIKGVEVSEGTVVGETIGLPVKAS